jgi:prepilin-type N-terminal cleavage/methylation domain-containing protein
MIRSAESDGNTSKKRFLSPTGFTLVELLVAVVIGSILVLTVGLILVSAQTHWAEGSKKLALQRDASIAMYRMERAIRGGDQAVNDSGALKIIDADPATKPWKRFFRDGTDFKYQEEGWEDTETIINGKVNNFTFSFGGSKVDIGLRLEDGNIEVNFTTTAMLRKM